MMIRSSKYKAKKVEYNGIKFDSKSELDYYMHLLTLEKSGQVSDIELQPSFVLQPKYRGSDGKIVREIKYIADFKYRLVEANKWVIIDVKGMPTEVAKLKRKMFNYIYPELELLWVKKKRGEWVNV